MDPLTIAAQAWELYQFIQRLRALNTDRSAQGLPPLTQDEFVSHVREAQATGQEWLRLKGAP